MISIGPLIKKQWFRKLVACLFGFSLLIGIELTLRITGSGEIATTDPFVGIQGVQPLFVQDGKLLRTADSKVKFFPRQSFPLDKPDIEERIFVLGGSTVNGRPYADPTSFSRWLEIALNASDSHKRYRVINCGGVSYASYRLVHVLREVIQYSPDKIILCTGHNEFLEDRSYSHLKELPQWVGKTEGFVGRLASYQLLRRVVYPSSRENQERRMSDEVEALLDYRGGIESYVRDEGWEQSVFGHFQYNVQQMHSMCQESGVELLLLIPPSNILDSPPFKAVADESLSFEGQEKVRELEMEGGIDSLRELVAVDPKNAHWNYRLGKELVARARTVSGIERAEMESEALLYLNKARDEDVCPLRMPTVFEKWLREFSTKKDIRFFDAADWFAENSEHRITGNQWLVDHVHPSITGHQVIATNLATLFKTTHEDRVTIAFQRHLDSLPEDYHDDAAFRLNGLRAWAEGRVDGPTIDVLKRKSE